MRECWRNLRYILRHKWLVLLYCCRDGYLWAGLTHDLSKFRPDEFLPYAQHFYGPHYSDQEVHQALRCGCVLPFWCEIEERFARAWLLHQHRNPHHWQHWCLVQDDDPDTVLEMPERYLYEMLADWRSAGQVQGRPDTRAWYLAHRAHIRLHPRTRARLEQLLEVSDAIG